MGKRRVGLASWQRVVIIVGVTGVAMSIFSGPLRGATAPDPTGRGSREDREAADADTSSTPTPTPTPRPARRPITEPLEQRVQPSPAPRTPARRPITEDAPRRRLDELPRRSTPEPARRPITEAPVPTASPEPPLPARSWPLPEDRERPVREPRPRPAGDASEEPFKTPAIPDDLDESSTSPPGVAPVSPREDQPAPQAFRPGAGVDMPDEDEEEADGAPRRLDAIERALERRRSGPGAAADRVPAAGSEVGDESISADAFIATPFAEAFSSGDYARALAELEVLQDRYPSDRLIMRYRAIVLDRLGRHDEALDLYERLLARTPNHVPTRFFRGQTYYNMGDYERASEDLDWVADNSVDQYRGWSRQLTDRMQSRRVVAPERKRLYVFGNVGWEYDSNVILKSNDPGLGVGEDRNAGRFPLNLGVGYRFIQQPDLRVDGTYVSRLSFHDDSLDEYNFIEQEAAVDLRKRVSFAEQDMTLGLRYELSGGFLDENLFAVNNEFTTSSDVRFTPRSRSVLYYRLTAAEFGPDGSDPSRTSRDGLENDLGITHYVYSDDFRRYVFVNQEFSDDAKHGDNYDRVGFTTRAGLHTPVPFLLRTDVDTSVSFRYMEYPNFSSVSALDPNDRLDNNWEYYLALTHRLTPRLLTRAFYRYVNANNRNDFYQYDRHVAGTQLLFTQYY